MLTMGDDFHYQYAESWFKNLDKLIKYVNQQVVLLKFAVELLIIEMVVLKSDATSERQRRGTDETDA